MAYLFITPRPQLVSATNALLANGQLFFYESGTSTPKNTYSDSGLNSANANPVVLDARGEPDNAIYLDGTYKVIAKDADDVTLWTEDNYTGIAQGAANVAYDQGGTGSVATTVEAKLQEFVSVKDFGAVGDGTTNDSTALEAARDWLAAESGPAVLVFPAGIYKYDAALNWAIQDATIISMGEVRLRYTGNGVAVTLDAGSDSTDHIYNVTMGRFIVESTSSGTYGVYVRGVHHSKLGFNVRGCSATLPAMLIQFAVATEFDTFVCSVNEEGAWYTAAKPLNGIEIDARGAQKTTACTFTNPIIEGVGGDGIVLTAANQNRFVGGTSEGNTGWGITVADGSGTNTFEGIDLEVNNSGDISDSGQGNCYRSIYSDSSITIGASAIAATFIGGTVNSIVDNGVGTHLDMVRYANASGSISGSGTYRSKTGVYRISAAGFDDDLSVNSLEATVSCDTATATTLLTLPNTNTRTFLVIAQIKATAEASNYGAYAIIHHDATTATILHQVNGGLLTITLSGLNIQATQSSGITANVYMKAAAI